MISTNFSKLVLLLVVATCVLVVAAWNAQYNQPYKAPLLEQPSIWIDEGTGCEYFLTSHSITPRNFSDGVQVCPGDAPTYDEVM